MPGITPRKVIDEVVDLVLYAPVGLAATVVEELPALVEKGKSRLTMARTIGQFAFAVGRQRVEQAVADRRNAAAATATEAPAGEAPAGEAESEAGEGVVVHGDRSADISAAGPAGPAGDAGGGAVVEAAADGGGAKDLAIPGYDSLAASQVVQRLAGLSPAELEAVRDYEEATRGRRTILGRIAQLTSNLGGPGGE